MKKINAVLKKENLLIILVAFWLVLLLVLIIFINPLSNALFDNEHVCRGEFLTKVILPVFAALVGIIGVLLSIKRTDSIVSQTDTMKNSLEHLKEQDKIQKERFKEDCDFRNKELDQKIKIDETNMLEIEFKNAVEHLSSDNLVLSLSGIHELDGIAKKSKGHRHLIFDILCSRVRYTINQDNFSTIELDKAWSELDIYGKMAVKPSATTQAIFKILFSENENSIYKDFKANLSNSDLRNIDLVGLHFTNVDFGNSAMHFAKMYSSNNEKPTSFINCNFYDTYLQGANMSMTTFKDCKFTNAHMFWTNLCGCTLTNCKFNDADLACSILTGARMTKCDFRSTCLDGSEIKNAYFDAVNGEKNVFDGTTFCFASIFPADWFYFKDATLVHEIDVTGAQQDLQYDKLSRIKRLITYTHKAKSLNLGSNLHVEDANITIREKRYVTIVEKIMKYAIMNKMYEYKSLDDLETEKKTILSQLISKSKL